MQDDSDLDVPAELFHRAEAIMARAGADGHRKI
jgi:hypothetical protein